MDINLELYKIFYTVAKYKSFSDTAKKLYISQPAITQRINSLENQLNCKLFYRMADGVKLTEDGKKLFEYIKNSMETMSNIEDKFNEYKNSKLLANIIKIQTTSSINSNYIYNQIIQFLKREPNVEIEVIQEANIKNGIDALSNKEIDLLVFDYPYRIRKNNIEISLIEELEQILYTSKTYLEKNKELNIYKENKYRFILPSKGVLEREKINKYFFKQNIYVNSNYEINDLNTRNFFVENDLGIALGLKSNIEKELEGGKFVEISTKEKLPTYNIYMAKLKDNNIVSKFINIA